MATAPGKKVWFSQKFCDQLLFTKLIYTSGGKRRNETRGSRATANLISFNYKRKNKLSHLGPRHTMNSQVEQSSKNVTDTDCIVLSPNKLRSLVIILFIKIHSERGLYRLLKKYSSNQLHTGQVSLSNRINFVNKLFSLFEC